jgi:ABC-type multidrug transport system ATPase subunit
MQLSIKELPKRYGGGKLGHDGFTAEVLPGVRGLRCPDGTGKSTLMRTLATVTKPTADRAELDGVDIRPSRKRTSWSRTPAGATIRPHATQIGGIVPAYTGQRPHERVHDRHSSPRGSCLSFRARRRR